MYCATFYQSALRHEQHERVILSFRVDSSTKFCSDLPVKGCEGDRELTLTTLAFVFNAVPETACKSGRLIVTSYDFKLCMLFLSSLASVVEFLNQMKRNRRY